MEVKQRFWSRVCASDKPVNCLGISKNKFNLETRFVICEDRFCIQVLIGRKQEGIVFFVFDLLID